MIFTIGSAVVDLIIKNKEQAQRALDDVEKKYEDIEKAADKAQQSSTNFISMIGKSAASAVSILSKFRTGLLGVTGVITGFAASSMIGTVEGKQLAESIRQLSRVFGDAFAPIIRVVTSYIGVFTNYLKSFGKEGKAAIIILTGMGFVLAGILTVFITMIPVAVSLATAVFGVAAAFTALDIAAAPILGPLMLIGAAITAVLVGMAAWAVAIPAAFVGALVYTRGWQGALEEIIAILIQMKDIGVATFNAIKGAIDGANASTLGLLRSLGAVLRAMSRIPSRLLGVSEEDRKRAQSFTKGLMNGGGLTPSGGGFESLQGTYERVQTAILDGATAPATALHQEEANKLLEEIKNNTKQTKDNSGFQFDPFFGPSFRLS